MSNPMVSVLLPVHNGEEHIDLAIQSVLDQTFSSFELLLIDDRSTDSSIARAESHGDARISILRPSFGQGLVNALNFGLKHCRGTFIARMDADDICHPERFAAQVNLLERDSGCAMVHTDAILIDQQGVHCGHSSSKSANLEETLLYKRPGKPIIHPSAMIRRDCLDAVGGYREYQAAEDHDLWLRLLCQGNIQGIEEDLLFYRINPNGVSRTKASLQASSAIMSAVNYEYSLHTGIDLYLEHRPLWEDISLVISFWYEQSLLPVDQSRGRLRSLRRARKLGPLIFEGLRTVFACPTALLESSAIRHRRRLVERALGIPSSMRRSSVGLAR